MPAESKQKGRLIQGVAKSIIKITYTIRYNKLLDNVSVLLKVSMPVTKLYSVPIFFSSPRETYGLFRALLTAAVR
jgi:hypothetical protein